MRSTFGVQASFAAIVGFFVLTTVLTTGVTGYVVGSQSTDATVIGIAARQRLLSVEIGFQSQSLVSALESESTTDEIVASVANKVELLKNTLLLAFAAILVLAFLTWFFVRRKIVGPVSALTAGIRRITTESDPAQLIGLTSRDEIGQVFHDFNSMLIKFQSIIRELAAAVSRVDEQVEGIAS